ncbi:MAG TPA: hypothetical protein VF134_02210 [Candidatus Dormibacteraeota bacterium]
MGIDVKEIRDSTMEAEETMAGAATGAIVTAVDAATHPGRTIRRLERRGEPVNRSLRRQANRTADDIQEAAVDVVSGNLAERITLAGIRLAKSRARRKDVIGDVLSAGLSVLHRGLSATAHEVGKFEKATEPPSRPTARRTSPARRSSTRTTRSRRSTARRRS